MKKYRNLKILRQIFQDITAAGCTTAVLKKGTAPFLLFGYVQEADQAPSDNFVYSILLPSFFYLYMDRLL